AALSGRSSGWARAGRFPPAPRPVPRFLPLLGGSPASRPRSRAGASAVLFPPLVGAALFAALAAPPPWDVLVAPPALL
ncbi:hypothetical protein C3R44_23835, partial [Mycobacterium tuberculosis]